MLGIVDGRNLCFRALVSGPLLTTNGLRTEIPFLMLKVLSKVARDHKIDRYIVCWEGGLLARRVATLPTYKDRKPDETGMAMREAIAQQTPLVEEMLDHLGVQQFQFDGLEADDVIGYLVRYHSRFEACTILSTDKDFFILVNPQTQIVRAPDRPLVNLENFEKEAGVGTPIEFHLARSITGDPSDNIPGIPGVGWGTASKLVRGCQNLADLYEKTEKYPGKRGDSLRNQKADIARNYRLLEMDPADIPEDYRLYMKFAEAPSYNDTALTQFLIRTQMHSVLGDKSTYLVPFGWRNGQ